MAAKRRKKAKEGQKFEGLSARIDADLYALVAEESDKKGLSMTWVLEDIIEQQLGDKGKEETSETSTDNGPSPKRKAPTILTVINFKGGVAKTTTTTSLATCLGKLGKKVLVIDFDAQGNASISFNVFDKKKKEPCIVDVLFASERGQEKMTLEEVMRGTACQNVKVVPSNMRFLKADAMIRNENGSETLLQYAIQDLIDEGNENFDYIIIDLGPNLNMTTTNALVAMEIGNENSMVILPVKLDEYSIVGIPEVVETIENVAKARRTRTQKWRILLTIVEPTTVAYDAALDELQKEVPDARYFETQIRKATKVNEATLAKLPFSAYAPRTNAAKDYYSLAKEIETMHE